MWYVANRWIGVTENIASRNVTTPTAVAAVCCAKCPGARRGTTVGYCDVVVRADTRRLIGLDPAYVGVKMSLA